MSFIGKIVTGADVEAAAETTIKMWQADYLAEVADQAGISRGALPQFRSYPRLLDVSKWNEDQTPACVVSAPGTLQNPIIKDRKVLARWALGIGCIVSAKDMQSTLRLAQLYSAAIRGLFMQHSSLGGFSNGIAFLSERYDDLTSDASRSLASGVCQFGVDVFGIVDTSQGTIIPAVDATLPTGDWSTVAAVDVDLEKVNP